MGPHNQGPLTVWTQGLVGKGPGTVDEKDQGTTGRGHGPRAPETDQGFQSQLGMDMDISNLGFDIFINGGVPAAPLLAF